LDRIINLLGLLWINRWWRGGGGCF